MCLTFDGSGHEPRRTWAGKVWRAVLFLLGLVWWSVHIHVLWGRGPPWSITKREAMGRRAMETVVIWGWWTHAWAAIWTWGARRSRWTWWGRSSHRSWARHSSRIAPIVSGAITTICIHLVIQNDKHGKLKIEQLQLILKLKKKKQLKHNNKTLNNYSYHDSKAWLMPNLYWNLQDLRGKISENACLLWNLLHPYKFGLYSCFFFFAPISHKPILSIHLMHISTYPRRWRPTIWSIHVIITSAITVSVEKERER